MKVLVTGATGFLGSHVAEQLARRGHEVRVLVRSTSDRSFLRGVEAEEAVGDIMEADSLPAAVEGVDAIVHAAGLVKARSEAEFNAVNVRGTANLLDALGSSNGVQRFVYISSLAAHGPSEDGSPRRVDAAAEPVSAYGRSKLRAEGVVRAWAENGGSAAIIRPPVIYGPRDRALLSFFRLARWRLAPLLQGGKNAISVVYVEDAARAAVLTATAEGGAPFVTYTLDDGSVYSWRDLLRAVEKAIGRRALRLYSPGWAYAAAGAVSETFGRLRRQAVALSRDKVVEMRQPYWVCSHEGISRDLGWEPQVLLGEGAALTAAWYRQQGWL